MTSVARNVLPIYGNGNSILIHDNAPQHTNYTTKTTHEFLERKGVNTMQWTAISPDMIPIEHVWAHLKQKMRKTLS